MLRRVCPPRFTHRGLKRQPEEPPPHVPRRRKECVPGFGAPGGRPPGPGDMGVWFLEKELIDMDRYGSMCMYLKRMDFGLLSWRGSSKRVAVSLENEPQNSVPKETRCPLDQWLAFPCFFRRRGKHRPPSTQIGSFQAPLRKMTRNQ